MSSTIENPLISVVIPCFNSERFIEKTIDSVLHQSYKNVEVVCVNDGSSDNTLGLLKEIGKKNTQLKVIDKKNQGVEFAIKDALSACRGEFIFFLGHDDWISEDAFAKAMNAFNNNEQLDAVRMDLFFIFPDETIKEKMQDRRILSGEEAVLETIGDWNIHTFCLWKANIALKMLDVSTDGAMDFDEFASRYLYSFCKKVGYCDGIYYYLQHPHSVSKKIALRRVEMLKTDAEIRNFLINKHLYEKCETTFEQTTLSRLCLATLFFHAVKKDNEQHEKYLKILKEGYKCLNKDIILKNRNASIRRRLQNFLLLTNFQFLFFLTRVNYFLRGRKILSGI
jgi:glycosyltransferase involved in cell wall biosynthesis